MNQQQELKQQHRLHAAGRMGGKSWLRTAGFEQAQFRGNEREGEKREGML